VADRSRCEPPGSQDIVGASGKTRNPCSQLIGWDRDPNHSVGSSTRYRTIKYRGFLFRKRSRIKIPDSWGIPRILEALIGDQISLELLPPNCPGPRLSSSWSLPPSCLQCSHTWDLAPCGSSPDGILPRCGYRVPPLAIDLAVRNGYVVASQSSRYPSFMGSRRFISFNWRLRGMHRGQ